MAMELHNLKVKAYEEDYCEYKVMGGPWNTDMTMEQGLIIMNWVRSLKESEPANSMKVQDDMMLRAPELEHSKTE
eukprot:14459046-Heterocapsa_arctica.AAC.1